jgi:hypothetical protein
MSPAAGTRHLYVHVPFCAHRCGYCDFVTVTGHEDERARYVDAVIAEIDRAGLEPETVFVGGGTPSILADVDLARLLAALPEADEITVECNPETITPAKARVLVEGGVTRVSLGAQTFRPHLLDVLERRVARSRSRLRSSAARGGHPKPQPRPDLWGSGPGVVRPSSGPRGSGRARAGPRELLRARGQARHALHSPVRPRARAAGGRDGGVLRAGRGDAPQRRLPLVRDRQLLPAGARVPAQPRLLARARLPGRGRRRSRRSASSGAGTGPVCAGTSRLSKPAANRPPSSSC